MRSCTYVNRGARHSANMTVRLATVTGRSSPLAGTSLLVIKQLRLSGGRTLRPPAQLRSAEDAYRATSNFGPRGRGMSGRSSSRSA